MADLIQLLPDAIANQIAAGEVIQRPASVVKELMENAIDAGGSEIKLIVKDAGKSLIQVIDNGCGMSGTDARMAFERHATSKIRQADDLYAIRTMGFRGEALASIAAIAQVEMRTRRKPDELGSRLLLEGSEVKTQEPCQASGGTNISVKNLFFNVPARRNFLKSDTVEMRHILEEFQRLAIAHPDLAFSLHHNGNEVYRLTKGNQRQRVTAVLGSNSNKKLVPVTQETDVLGLSGFIGKPEFARKTRGEQFFFVNRRYIRSSYLDHAVRNAYEDLLPDGTYPLYTIFLDIDPQFIDINVHPTKQEIKFEDERLVYNYLRVAVKHALGQHSITPTLDFDQEQGFVQVGGAQRFGSRPENPSARLQNSNLRHWEMLYRGLQEDPETPRTEAPRALTIESTWNEEGLSGSSGGEQGHEPYQIHGAYIVSAIKSGFLLIDQRAAHQRILYERFLGMLNEQTSSTQQQLFPQTVHLSPADSVLLEELRGEIAKLGFDIQPFGQETFVINGVPAEWAGKGNETEMVENLLEQFKSNRELRLDKRENLARSMASSAAMKRGQLLSPQEMRALIDRLFACTLPFKSPSGRKCFVTFELDELDKRFDA